MPNVGNRGIGGKCPDGLDRRIVGLLTTYMTSVARVAGHWVLGCRDCLGKLLRQQGRAGGGRRGKVGALGREANTACEPEPRTPTHIHGIPRDTHKCKSPFDHQKDNKSIFPHHKGIFIFVRRKGVIEGPLMQRGAGEEPSPLNVECQLPSFPQHPPT